MPAPPPNQPLTYEVAREMAANADPRVRRELAARPDLPPEVLYYLAEDDSADVRRAVAANAAAPHHTHMMLAQDGEIAVRSDLAAKVSRLLPGLSPAEHDKVRQSAHDALRALARDQMTAVRQVLAEALKDVAHAPADVIRTLAGDAESAVASPILEFSPVLTDEDLIEIIRKGPAAGGLSSIARRKTVSERVGDAVAATEDSTAVATLLNNRGAQIREETLDRLIEQSSGNVLWQAPLASRHALSSSAAAKLALVLADNLLEKFSKRTDLDPATMNAVKGAVHQRLTGGTGGGQTRAPMVSVDPLRDEPPMEMIREMHAGGRLDAATVTRALQSNDLPFAIGALVVLSGMDLAIVRRIVQEKNTKALVALTWKAKLPMSVAVPVQLKLARVAPGDVIRPVLGDEYPMGEDEMSWQVEFYVNLAAKKKG